MSCLSWTLNWQWVWTHGYITFSGSSELPTSEQVLKLRIQFKRPQWSELTHGSKKFITVHLRSISRRKSKLLCSNDPKSVTKFKARLSWWGNHSICEKLFCTACKEELLLKLSIVSNRVRPGEHVLGAKRPWLKEKFENEILLRQWKNVIKKCILSKRLYQSPKECSV